MKKSKILRAIGLLIGGGLMGAVMANASEHITTTESGLETAATNVRRAKASVPLSYNSLELMGGQLEGGKASGRARILAPEAALSQVPRTSTRGRYRSQASDESGL